MTLRPSSFHGSRSGPSVDGHPETMKMTEATPHLHSPPPLPSPHGRGERGRGERVRGHFQSSEESQQFQNQPTTEILRRPARSGAPQDDTSEVFLRPAGVVGVEPWIGKQCDRKLMEELLNLKVLN
jgi:hypothetical protein